ncbi:MAG: efflux RND transporter periplasmic adaptor subunit, partial [Pseudohongiella sp.]
MRAMSRPKPLIRYAVMLAMSIGLASCNQASDSTDSDTATAAARDQAVTVRVARASLSSSDETLRFAGISRARQRASLTFQVDGVLRSRAADIGQQVEAGQILAELYNPQLEPARDAARSRLEQLSSDIAQARRDLERTEQLYERGVSPLSDLEQQRSRVESLVAAVSNAEAALQQSQGLLAENALRAPFSGNIEAVLLEPGEFAQAGQPVIRLAARDGMEIEIRAPAHLLRELSIGQTLPVWSGLTGAQRNGQVLEIGSSSSGANTLFPLVVGLDGSEIRAGEAYEVGI